MDGLPELQPVHENEEVIKNTQEWHGLEIEMPESESESEEDNSVFEAPKAETKPDSKPIPIGPVEPKRKYKKQLQSQQVIDVEPEDAHLSWLLDIFEEGDLSDLVYHDEMKQLFTDYKPRYGNVALITANRFLKKYYPNIITGEKVKRIRCCQGIRIRQNLPSCDPLPKPKKAKPEPELKKKLMKEIEEHESEHTHSHTMDFDTFKEYLDAYNREKEHEQNKVELERLRKEKEDKALEAKFYEKFKQEQKIKEQHQMPDTFSHIDWSSYRGL